jgi:hypothetical protein
MGTVVKKMILAIVLLVGMAAVAAPQAEAQASPPIDIPVAGVADGTTFAGTFELERFVFEGGVISAVGTLTGTLTDAAGNVIGTVTDLAVELPLTEADGTCDLLHLELGPVDLDLLGLVVHLDQVVLDIDAEAGSGNLLGNLLCAVARLLDSNASGNAITNMLNRILSLIS